MILMKKATRIQRTHCLMRSPVPESNIFLLEMAVCCSLSTADLPEIVSECWALCSDNCEFITITVGLYIQYHIVTASGKGDGDDEIINTRRAKKQQKQSQSDL